MNIWLADAAADEIPSTTGGERTDALNILHQPNAALAGTDHTSATQAADGAGTSESVRFRSRMPQHPEPVIHNLSHQHALTDLLVLPGMINETEVGSLVDSGASSNFMDLTFAKAHGHVVTPTHFPKVKVRMADGRVARATGTATCEIVMGAFKCTTTFTVLPLAKGQPIILGIPWLRQHDPHINWTTGGISINGTALPTANPQVRKTVIKLLDAKHMAKLLRSAKQNREDTKFFYGSLRELRDEIQVELNKVGDAPTSQGNMRKVPAKDLSVAEQIAAIDTDLGPEFTAKLHKLMNEFALCTDKPPGLPPDRGIGDKLHIKLVDGAEPPKPKIYRMSPAELRDLKEQIDGYLAKGFIRPSGSSFAAPVLFARKPDGSLRMCIDYRGLNLLTVKDKYPLPRIDDLLDILAGASVFTLMDMAQGYHQILVAEEDTFKTAFNTRYGQFEWVVMPFGLSNCPAMLQRTMNIIFKPYLDEFVMVYMDDVMVFSKSPEEHIKHLTLVLQALKKYQFFIRLNKCTFGRT